MMCFKPLLWAALAWPLLLQAGPKEDAQAAYDKFFPAFVVGNFDQVAGFFAPDAQFYGTASRDLVTTAEGVHQYFKTALSNPAPVRATPLGSTALVLSDSVVLISGTWQAERVVDGKTVVGGPFRNTVVMHKRGDRWMIVQFHNSPQPKPPAPAPTR